MNPINKPYIQQILKQKGYLCNKSALFYYLNDSSDLIGLKFDDICNSLFRMTNKENFVKLSWENIILRLQNDNLVNGVI